MTRLLGALPLCVLLATTGCVGSVEHWVVNTRVNQGDVALARGSAHEAQIAYRLALKVDPHDARARAGLSQAAAAIAETDYAKGDFDDAMAVLIEAQRIDPQSVRLQALRSQIDGARLKQEIVSSNYPAYERGGLQLREGYASLGLQAHNIVKSLRRFSYTYDTQDLTRAILNSYELQSGGRQEHEPSHCLPPTRRVRRSGSEHGTKRRYVGIAAAAPVTARRSSRSTSSGSRASP